MRPRDGGYATFAFKVSEGSTLGDFADATGRSKGTVRWHLKQIFREEPDLASGRTGTAGSVVVRSGEWSAMMGRSVGLLTLRTTRSVTP